MGFSILPNKTSKLWKMSMDKTKQDWDSVRV